MIYEVSIDGEPAVEIDFVRRGHDGTIWLGGRPLEVRSTPRAEQFQVTVNEHSENVWVAVKKDEVFVHAFGRSWTVSIRDAREAAARRGAGAGQATAPMPGTVVSVSAVPGQAVSAGQVLLVIESMKMQTEVVAPRDGVVERIPYQVGETFDRGAALATLVAEQED